MSAAVKLIHSFFSLLARIILFWLTSLQAAASGVALAAAATSHHLQEAMNASLHGAMPHKKLWMHPCMMLCLHKKLWVNPRMKLCPCKKLCPHTIRKPVSSRVRRLCSGSSDRMPGTRALESNHLSARVARQSHDILKENILYYTGPELLM